MIFDDAPYTPDTHRLLSPTERIVAALWCEALELPDLPESTSNFFSLGGDSMTMTMVEFRIKEELSVDLPAGSMLVASTLQELSALIDGKLPNVQDPPQIPPQ